MTDTAFDDAARFTAAKLRRVLLALPETEKRRTFEIRLRTGQPVVLFGSAGSVLLRENGQVTRFYCSDVLRCGAAELQDTFLRCCDFSLHTHAEELINGFVPLPGGHRLGVAGTAVVSPDGTVTAVRDVCALNLRVARHFPGSAKPLLPLFSNGLQSVLLAGPPASGKTTMLRDLVVSLSSFESGRAYKLCVVDARRELQPQSDALNCDVYTSYPMALAVTNAVKTMAPQLIVCDEVALQSEIDAIRYGANTGVRFVASVHAESRDELVRRPQVQQLLSVYSFEKVVLLRSDTPCAVREIFDAKELLHA